MSLLIKITTQDMYCGEREGARELWLRQKKKQNKTKYTEELYYWN